MKHFGGFCTRTFKNSSLAQSEWSRLPHQNKPHKVTPSSIKLHLTIIYSINSRRTRYFFLVSLDRLLVQRIAQLSFEQVFIPCMHLLFLVKPHRNRITKRRLVVLLGLFATKFKVFNSISEFNSINPLGLCTSFNDFKKCCQLLSLVPYSDRYSQKVSQVRFFCKLCALKSPSGRCCR